MLVCLESEWNSMGVLSTRAPARGGWTSSGRRNSWSSLGEILFWCQSPSWSLVNPLPLPPWVDHFQRPSSLPSPQRWRSWWLKWRSCIRSISAWPRRQRMLKSKGTECVIGYWTWRTRSMMCKRKYGSWNKIWMVKKRSWHSMRPGKKSWKLLVWRVQ